MKKNYLMFAFMLTLTSMAGDAQLQAVDQNIIHLGTLRSKLQCSYGHKRINSFLGSCRFDPLADLNNQIIFLLEQVQCLAAENVRLELVAAIVVLIDVVIEMQNKMSPEKTAEVLELVGSAVEQQDLLYDY